MKIIHFDGKTGEMKLVADTNDDLWHIEKVIEKGDLAEASTLRTYKVGKREEKKRVRIKINVERVEYSKSVNRLRLLGKIISGSPKEFVQLGKHHTIDIEPGTKFKIIKRWKQYQIKRLKQAVSESKKPRIRIIVMDDEKALTAVLRPFGMEYGPEFYSTGSKRDEKYEEAEKSYLGKIAAEIGRHEEKYIVAGPGFEKEKLKKFLSSRNPELLKRITFESCSYAERSGVDELLKRGVVEKIAGEERYEQELKMVEELITEINKDRGKAAYGIKEVKKAVEYGAVSRLLVLDEYIRTSEEAEKAAEAAEKSGADVMIVSSDGDAGLKLKGMGKIGAFLRFRIQE